jgi:hypothetical protein
MPTDELTPRQRAEAAIVPPDDTSILVGWVLVCEWASSSGEGAYLSILQSEDLPSWKRHAYADKAGDDGYWGADDS